MKRTLIWLSGLLITLPLTTTLPTPFAQDYTQFNLPEGAKARFGRGKGNDIAYSPDGSRLAVATNIGIWIYDVHTSATLDVMLQTNGANRLAFNPDGNTLASGSRKNKIILWDAVSGQQKAILEGVPFGCYSLTFSPDGRTLAAGSYEHIYLWDAVSGHQKAVWVSHPSSVVWHLTFSPDGRTLASAGMHDIRLWDAVSGQPKATLAEDIFKVNGLVFSPDGRTLASGGIGNLHGGIRLWDPVSGQQKAHFEEGTYIGSLAFSPDGRTLVSGSSLGLYLWDPVSGQQKAFRQGANVSEDVVFSPNGRTLAGMSWDGTISLWDAASSGAHRMTLTGHMGVCHNITFSPNGRTLAGASRDGIHLWDLISGQQKAFLDHQSDSGSVAFSPDGRTLASGGQDGTIRLWDAASGAHKMTLTGHTSGVTSVAFSPDGRTLASGDWIANIRLWDVVSGAYKMTLTGHKNRIGNSGAGITCVAFSPDSRTLASGGQDGTIRLWDAASGAHKMTLTSYRGTARSIAFSPDGQTLFSMEGPGAFTGHADPRLLLWDLATGEHKVIMPIMSSVLFALSPDGQMLASIIEGQVQLLDASTGAIKAHVPAPSFSALAFSPDGQTLAGGTPDGFIFLQELTSAMLQQRQRILSTLKELPPNFPPATVRLIYFYPRDITPQPNMDRKLDTLIKETQQFYAEQMENHGFGRKTFTFETDANGNAVVHHVQGLHNAADYDLLKVMDATWERHRSGRGKYLVVADESIKGQGFCGMAISPLSSPVGVTRETNARHGVAVIGGGACFNVGVAAHELGHTAGLKHDYRDSRYVMNHLGKDRFSYAAAAWLDASAFLNPGQVLSEAPAKIEVLSPEASRLRFRVTDADGLRQAQLIFTEREANNPCGTTESLYGHKILNGNTSSTFEFVATEASSDGVLQVVDVHGTVAGRGFLIQRGVADPPATTDTTVSVSPSPVQSPAIGAQLTLSLKIAAGANVAAYQATIQFDTAALRYVSSANGDYLPAGAFVAPAVLSGNKVSLAATSLSGESNGDGTLATLTFEVIAVKASTLTLSDLVLSDSAGAGIRPQVQNGQVVEPTQVKGDVNQDGVVNIQDLVLVAGALRQTGQSDADMNGDGVVNIQDLVLVAGALGNTGAAPSAHPQLAMLTVADVQEWLTQARGLPLTDATSQRGILFLEQLRAALTPKETILLPNYPNPFNPETWIPYQLAHAADVKFTIYDANGAIVRQFDLGHQSAGFYTDRAKAAHWDGRNENGELVASGVYFYQFHTGDYTTTRRMIILK